MCHLIILNIIRDYASERTEKKYFAGAKSTTRIFCDNLDWFIGLANQHSREKMKMARFYERKPEGAGGHLDC